MTVTLRAAVAAFVLLVWASVPTAWAQPQITSGPDLGQHAIGPLYLPLSADGGTAPYTWTATTPLPEGMALRAEVPPWFPPGSSAGLIGVPVTPGTHVFTLQVTDAIGATDSRAFTLSIGSLLVVDNYNVPEAFVGEPYSYTLSALGASGPVTYVPQGAMPPGLSLSASGVISGVPSSAGGYSFGVTASDGTATAHRGFHVAVHGVRITTPAWLPSVSGAAPVAVTLGAAGGTPPYAWHSGGLPQGLSLSAAGDVSGSLLWTGTYRFQATVTDAAGFTHSRNFVIASLPAVPDLPQLFLEARYDDFVVGEPRAYAFQVTGGTPPYSWSANGLPPGLTLGDGTETGETWTWPNDGVISGMLQSAGPHTFELSVTDSSPTPVTVTRAVTFHGSALGLRESFPFAAPGDPYTYPLDILGGRPPYTGALVGGTLPTGVTFDGSTLTFSGTPLEPGSYRPLVLVTDDDGRTLRRSLAIFINGPGVQISTDPRLPQATRDQPYFMNLWAWGASGSIVWSIESGALPAGVSLAPDGTLSGTPTVAGTFGFRARAEDSADAGNVALRDFTLRVTPIQQTSSSQLPFATAGTFYSTTLTVTGGATGYTWSVPPSSVLPPGLTLTTAGVLQGTPLSPGQFSFEVSVVDQLGQPWTGWYWLAIYPAGTLPPVSITMPSDLGTFALGWVEYQLSASGGDGHYEWAVVSGALPPGVAIRTDGPTWFQPGASGFVGIATTPGTYTFTLSATSGGQSATQAFTMRVATLLPLDNYQLPDAFLGQPYAYGFTANAPGATWAFSSWSPAPAGFALSSSGQLTGVPVVPGHTQLNIRVADGAEVVHRGYSLTVWEIRITTPGLLPNATQGSVYSQQLDAEGGTGTYVWSATGLPFGMTISPGGLLSGTPSGAGTYSIQATATDGASRFYTKRFTLVVVGVPPVLPGITTSFDLSDLTVGQPSSLGFSVWGGTAPYTWSVQNAPPGMWLRTGTGAPWLHPGQAELVGTVTTVGTYAFDVSVTDSSSPPVTVTRTYSVTVSSMALAWDVASGTMGLPYSTRLRVLGGTGPYVVALVGGKLPAGVTLAPDGTLSGTPLEGGSFSLSLLVTDAVGQTLYVRTGVFIGTSGSSTVQVATGYQLNFRAGQSTFLALQACCLPSYAWALEPGATLPPGLSFAATGQITGTPTSAGVFPFLARVYDPTNPANHQVREFVATVTALNFTGPFSLPFGVVGTPYPSTTLTVSGATGPVTWQVRADTALPPGLTLSASGVLSGTPTSAGQFQFTLEASDGSGPPLTQFMGMPVYPTGGGPPLSFNPPSTLSPRLGRVVVSLAASGGVPPYSFSLSPGAPAIPGMRVQDVGDLQPAGFPAANGSFIGVITTPGSYTTSLRVTDAAGGTMDRPMTVNVSPVLVASLTAVPDAVVGDSYAHQLEATGGQAPYLWTQTGGTLPAGLTLSASGLLSGIPAAPTSPSASVPVRVTDANGAMSTIAVLSISVLPFAIETSGVLPDATEGTGYAVTLDAPACAVCTWSTLNALPPGLTLSSSGVLSGVAPSARTTAFTIEARDTSVSPARVSRKAFTMHVLASTPLPPEFQTTFLNDTVIGATVVYSIAGRGGLPPYTVSLASGSLPPGLRLAPASAGSGLAPGVTYVTGVPWQTGDYSVALRITDALGAIVDRVFPFVVSPLNIEYQSLPLPGTTLRFQTPYAQSLLAVGGTGDYSWAPTTALPPGLALSGAGVVSGTPVNTGGFSTRVTVTDGAGATLNRPVGFGIGSGTAATLHFMNPQDLGTVTQGVPGYVLLGGTGSPLPAPEYAFSAEPGAPLPAGFAVLAPGELPAWVPPGQGLLVFTPVDEGPVSLTLRVEDAAGNFGVRTFGMTVVAPPCVYTLGASGATAGSGGGSGTIALTTGNGCAWEASADVPWIHVPAPSGTGAASIGYSVTANPDAGARTGSVTVAGQTFAITQFGSACAVAVEPASVWAPVGGSAAVLTVVTSLPGCAWTATSTEPWLRVTDGASGTGTGTVSLAIDPSSASGPRTGTIVFGGAGSAVVDVTQAGIGCGVTLSASGMSVGAAGGTGAVDVVAAPCGYTTLAPPQVTITSGGSGAGAGTVLFTVAPNAGTTARTLSLQIGGQTFAIAQAGLACTVALGASLPVFDAAGAGDSVTITTGSPDCAWEAQSSAPWLTLGSGAGTGSGAITFTVAANGDPVARVATITVGPQVVQVHQAGTVCGYDLRSSSGTVPASGGAGSVGVLAAGACTWDATTVDGWITVTGLDGAGTGFATFTAQPNPSAAPRVGTLTVAGQAYTVTQAGAPCVVTLAQPGASVSAAGAAGSVDYTTAASGCAVAVQSFSQWLSVSHTPSASGGAVSFTVAANPNNASRTGRFQVGDAVFTITQDASVGCAYSLAAYGATFAQAGGDGDLLASGSALGCTPAVGASPEIALGPLTFDANIFTQPYSVAPYVSSVIWVRTLKINFGGVTFTVKQTSW